LTAGNGQPTLRGVRILVTGSSGHLGEALVRALRDEGHRVVGLDRLSSAETDAVGSIADRALVRRAMEGIEGVVHTATLHKPHVATHPREEFVEVNVRGTLVLLEEAVRARAGRFVFTSTTSTFGRALVPPQGMPAAWITEAVTPVPKNVYGATKHAAEELCELVHRDDGLACIVLRTSRFFTEEDDDPTMQAEYTPDNLKANELLHRRVELGDCVDAHRLALERAPAIGFAKYIVSATTPFSPADAAALRTDAASVVRRHFPDAESIYGERGWRLPSTLDRVYDNHRARTDLGWRPRFDFRHVLDRLRAGDDVLGPVAARIGAKGYHR
jgi:UDP-glucose 4-epimerase